MGRLPPRVPAVNGIAERTAKSLRWELLDQIRFATVEELQCYLDQYRDYFNTARCHQALGGRAPAEYAGDVAVAEVIELNEIRRRKLVRRCFAHGLLNGYTLEPIDEAA